VENRRVMQTKLEKYGYEWMQQVNSASRPGAIVEALLTAEKWDGARDP
jgi:hypothetical protein